VGRDWASRMYCVTSDLDTTSKVTLEVARGRQLWPILLEPHKENSDAICEALTGENAKLKDLMKSACFGCVFFMTLILLKLF